MKLKSMNMPMTNDAEIVYLSKYIEHVERNIACVECGYTDRIILPATMPSKAAECPACNEKGHIIFHS